MFYAALVAQIIFFLYYNFSVPAISVRNRIWKFIESVVPVLGIILKIDWLITLSLVGYGMVIWETIMEWIMPSMPAMHFFSLKNIISGKASKLVKNMQPGDMQVSFEKPNSQKVISILLAVIAFIFTLLYYMAIQI